MFLKQITDSSLAQNSYLVGCQRTGEAIIVDPERDVDRYLKIAAANDLRISAVAETHIHADFVSGARELAADSAVQIYLSAEGGADWQSEWAKGESNIHLLRDGTTFHVGNIKFQTLHTPGHTPEHVCFLVTDEGGGADEPMVLLSGDFLFVGDVGRPDLLEQAANQAGTQEAGARQLYQSLKVLAPLSDYLQILPAHGAGSACGKSLGAVPVTTLGYEKRFNHALGLALDCTESEFVDFILDGQPEPPLYFGNMKVVNRAGPERITQMPTPPELNLQEISNRLEEPDFVILDTRPNREAFVSSHLRGSLYASAKGDFSGLAGSYLQPSDQIVLVVESACEVDNFVRLLFRIGFDHIVGWITAETLTRADQSLLTSTQSIQFDDLESSLHEHPDATILDVRRKGEFAAGHIRGAVNIAHTRLRNRVAELAPEGPVVVHCQSGTRASAAAAYLQRVGRDVIYINDSFTHAPTSLLA
jgi:hydroxyacylglutathione hydrolase